MRAATFFLELHVAVFLLVWAGPRVTVALAEGAEGATGEQHHSLLLPVVEEVVERPETPVLAEGVGGQVGVVAVDVAVGQADLLIQRDPEFVVSLGVLIGRRY